MKVLSFSIIGIINTDSLVRAKTYLDTLKAKMHIYIQQEALTMCDNAEMRRKGRNPTVNEMQNQNKINQIISSISTKEMEDIVSNWGDPRPKIHEMYAKNNYEICGWYAKLSKEAEKALENETRNRTNSKQTTLSEP